jgi:hypothetical protein
VTVVIVDLPDEPGPGIDALVPRILTCENHEIFEKDRTCVVQMLHFQN